MKKVIIKSCVNVDVMINEMKKEFEYLNNGWDYNDIKMIIENEGDGIYEFVFGCRGGLEDFIKNDEYLELKDIKELWFESDDVLIEDLEEFYYEMILEKIKGDYFYSISYLEEGFSVFVNVKLGE